MDTEMVSPFGVYVHVPFCRRRCDYCAFATYTDRDHLMGTYASALCTDISGAVEDGRLPLTTAVFFGGGTPSRLDPELLASVIDRIPLAGGAEVTVECNPEDVSPEQMAFYRSAGVTRISVGAQAVAPHVLASLGRHHQWAEVEEAAAIVGSAGFSSWNLDLIFGAAAEEDADWEDALARVLALGAPPPHVSAYALTIEPGTPLAADRTRHPDDDVQARRYRRADEILDGAGYEWEEISNWARPGHRCRYNNIAWSGGDYLGFGSAAHSHRDGTRWWNVRTPERYIAKVTGGASPVAGTEILREEQRRFERLSLALRTPAGVPDTVIPDVAELEGLVERRGGRAILTVAGRMLANEVIMRLEIREGALEGADILPR